MASSSSVAHDLNFCNDPQAERQKGQRKQQFVSRTIFHPSFKNISMPDAITFLEQQNDSINWLMRPSNKGTQQLSITLKASQASQAPPLTSPAMPPSVL